jgi:hypothetical protein
VLAFGDWARLGVGFATRLKLFQTFALARKKKESGEVEIDFHSHVQLGRYATGVLQLTRGLHNSIVQEAWRAKQANFLAISFLLLNFADVFALQT